MSYNIYKDKLLDIQTNLIKYIDGEDNIEENFQNVINLFFDQSISENHNDLVLILNFISKIAKNHRRGPNFFEKIEKIIQYLKNDILLNFTNYEIFNFFKRNKPILLFLKEENILTFNEEIINKITEPKYLKANYHNFFAPEIAPYIRLIKDKFENLKDFEITDSEEINSDDDDDLFGLGDLFDDELNFDLDHKDKDKQNVQKNEFKLVKLKPIRNYFEIRSRRLHQKRKEKNPYEYLTELPKDFYENRNTFENDNYISKLIREDSIEAFITYVKRNQYMLNSEIKPSIYETNSFLDNKTPSLIQYAAFFGSTQIFKYLYKNDVILESSLWLYAIHGNDAEIIQILEDQKVELNSFDDCLKEAIKCHHNDIVKYFEDRFAPIKYVRNQHYSFQYYNFAFLPDEFDLDIIIYEAYIFDYLTIVANYIKEHITDKSQRKSIITNLFARNKLKAIDIIIQLYGYFGEKHFIRCNKLVQMTIPSSVTSINKFYFFECSSLREVTIPSSVISIKKYAFYGCTSLNSIKIPFSVEKVGEKAFGKCLKLSKVSIQNYMTEISDDAFIDCSSIEEISVPSVFVGYRSYVFQRCFNIKKMSIEFLDSNPCSSFYDDIFEYVNVLEITGNINYFPNQLIEICKNLKEIIIKTPLISIDDNFLNGISTLQKIELPFALKSIGICAFQGCSSLQQLIIPPFVTSIGIGAFDGCSSLTQIKLPSSLTIIEECTFNDCYSLQSIIIPPSVEEIKDYAFKNCKSLGLISIPSSIVRFGNGIFDGVVSLEIFGNIYCIPWNLFNNNSTLNNLVINSSLLYIKERSFEGCSSLSNVSLPSSLQSIEPYSFKGCISLKTVLIPTKSSLNSIGNCAFEGCYSLVDISIPSTTSIGDGCFNGCSLLS